MFNKEITNRKFIFNRIFVYLKTEQNELLNVCKKRIGR